MNKSGKYQTGGKYTRISVSFPVERTKKVLRKADEEQVGRKEERLWK